jgi:prepilin-type N-terminal cleavage/methylation domain-containing protein
MFVNSLRQRGDTLVEVLIAIAVVSLVLGGAYVTTNRSLQATRSAQERAIALKLAESQIEQIKSLMGSSPAVITGAPSPFCIAAATGAPVAASNAACGVDPNGNQNSAEPIYHISVSLAGNDFTLTEWWYDNSGQTTDQIVLRYRVYD